MENQEVMAITGLEVLRREKNPFESLELTVSDVGSGSTCPHLREIEFDPEAVSPAILEGMETPIWKIK
jgi:hypothetical protein